MTSAASSVKQQLADTIAADAVVHGRVTLSSGKEADYYVDLRRVTLSGSAAPLVGRAMLELTADLEFDAVGGLTMGADPVATAMLHAAAADGQALDAFVVRMMLVPAALRLFGQQGFHATSIRQLSEDAKVAVPAIAYHFTDKAGLFRALFGADVERNTTTRDRALAEPDPRAAIAIVA